MPSAGDIVEVVLLYDDSDNNDQYVTGWGFVALAGAVDFQEISDDVHTALVKNSTGGILNGASTHVSITNQRVRDVKPGTGATLEASYTTVAGNDSGDRLPPQDATVLSWRTALSGRSFRGRTYIPAKQEGQQSNGQWNSGSMTAWQAIIDNMLTVFGPSGTNAHWRFGVISRITGGSPRPTPILTQVNGGHPDLQVFTQRRRVAGRGS